VPRCKPTKGNIVPRIREFQATLRDRFRPVEERRFALRSLEHLVENLQVPLHVGEDGDRRGYGT
jgi:hypothetical protein